jgi:hypothetical protein
VGSGLVVLYVVNLCGCQATKVFGFPLSIFVVVRLHSTVCVSFMFWLVWCACAVQFLALLLPVHYLGCVSSGVLVSCCFGWTVGSILGGDVSQYCVWCYLSHVRFWVLVCLVF